MNSYEFKGKTLYIGKYRIGIWWTCLDISNGMTGRVYFFPWNKLFINKKCKHAWNFKTTPCYFCSQESKESKIK